MCSTAYILEGGVSVRGVVVTTNVEHSQVGDVHQLSVTVVLRVVCVRNSTMSTIA